jgi:cobalt-precorrin 5A hydrolase
VSSAYSSTTAIIAVSKPGARLARRLASSLPGAELHLERRLADGPDDDTRLYDLPLRPVLQNLFVNRDALIVFLPIGAAVRLLAPVFAGKKRDPAVVCVDDGGRYAISVLSGHVGGGDVLARRVAEAIGAQPVITSASDALNVTAIDLVGRAQGWRIDASSVDLTRAAAAVVNSEPVALWLDPDTGLSWPDETLLSDGIVQVSEFEQAVGQEYAATLIVSDRILPIDVGHPVIMYRPPTLVAGMGCRRGVDTAHLSELLDDTLMKHGLARLSVAKVATADIKAAEPGLIALAGSLDVPLEIYAAAQLNAVGNQRTNSASGDAKLSQPTPSAAQDLLGVFGVSEPAAMLAAGADGLVVPRTKSDRATVAVARVGKRSGKLMGQV